MDDSSHQHSREPKRSLPCTARYGTKLMAWSLQWLDMVSTGTTAPNVNPTKRAIPSNRN